jgi:uncharacterized membrane protein YfcA
MQRVSIVVLALIAGVGAGCLGALLGIGGGVLLVPLLNIGMGIPFRETTAISLAAVLAMSASMAVSIRGRRLLNVRLAVFLLLFSVTGASVGAELLDVLPPAVFPRVFGVTAAFIAVVMLVRLDTRNILADPQRPMGVFDGRFHDEDTRQDVVYHVRRLPLASAGSFVAGVLASFVGIGGGILVVPSLNSWCGVPMRVAAATSVFMIGVTTVPAALEHWSSDYLPNLDLAGAAAIGVIIGFRAGRWLSGRARVRWIKLLMAGLLAVVAVEYLVG